MKPRLVICDLDGTLIAGSSERELLLMLFRERVLSPGKLVVFLCSYLSHPARTLREGRAWNRTYLKGLVPEAVNSAAFRLARRLEKTVRPGVAEKLREYRDSGAELVLLSASLEPLVREMASTNGFARFRGSSPEVSRNLFTGRVSGLRPWGEAKVAVAGEIMRDAGVTPRETVALGDSYSDRYLFEICAGAVAVHPDTRLKALAKKRGWMVLE
ncbi:MAG: HAD-IB family phosphatase [Candidatus Fermentibacteraceae bacterium]